MSKKSFLSLYSENNTRVGQTFLDILYYYCEKNKVWIKIFLPNSYFSQSFNPDSGFFSRIYSGFFLSGHKEKRTFFEAPEKKSDEKCGH